MRLQIFRAGTVIVLFFLLATALFSGCARAASTAERIHSMTPCGMVMGKMMGHGHVDQAHDETHQEPESETTQEM